jgi:hypothetical protein
MALLTHLDQDVTNGRDEQHSSSNAAGQPRTPLHRTGAWWQFPHITDRTALNKLRQLEDLCHGQDRALRRMLASSAADAAGIPRQQLVVFDGRAEPGGSRRRPWKRRRSWNAAARDSPA